jgi:hypothetical protein
MNKYREEKQKIANIKISLSRTWINLSISSFNRIVELCNNDMSTYIQSKLYYTPNQDVKQKFEKNFIEIFQHEREQAPQIPRKHVNKFDIKSSISYKNEFISSAEKHNNPPLTKQNENNCVKCLIF